MTTWKGNAMGGKPSGHDAKILSKMESHLAELKAIQLLTDSLFDIAVLIDRNGKVLAANKAAEKSVGTGRGEMQGRILFSFFRPKVANARKKRLQEAIAHKAPFQFVDSRDGRSFDNRISPVLDDRGEVSHVAIFGREITPQSEAVRLMAESYQGFDTLAEQIFDPLFLTDENGYFIMANTVACRTYGYTREELIGKHATFVSVDPASSGRVEGWKKMEPGHIIDTPSVHRRKDGTVFPVDLRGGIISWQGKNAAIAVVRDMTMWKKQEQEIIRARKGESIRILSGGIANDFQNILFAVMGNITLAREDIGEEAPAAEFLGEAMASCRHAQNLVRQFITLSGGTQPKKKMVPIIALMETISRDTLLGSRITARIEPNPDLWPAAFDPDQIEIVVHNLIRNAVEALPGGGEVQIIAENVGPDHPLRTELPLPGEKYVAVTIRDEGRGMYEEELLHIFDPYFSSKQTGGQGGVGLGLSVALAIIRKHEGDILVKSEKKKGTATTFFLPVTGPSPAAPTRRSAGADAERI